MRQMQQMHIYMHKHKHTGTNMKPIFTHMNIFIII